MNRETPPYSFQTMMNNAEMAGKALLEMTTKQDLIAEYRPWRKFRHFAADRGENPENLWLAAKFARLVGWRRIALRMADGREFGYNQCSEMQEALHRIDRATGGGGAAVLESSDGVLADKFHRDRLRIKTLMDEAAESSLIEGAVTTRAEAVEMLRSERSPTSKDERMVVNNYLAMKRIKEILATPLSTELLIDLQRLLTVDTLDKPDAVGRLRRVEEHVRVVDDRENEDIYVPPIADQLPQRLRELYAFANRQHKGPDFMHPIIKACILHFMIGYEHPFVDGNGRTARALFYWHALRHGYNIFEFIPISERIRDGYSKYPQAYLDTELDDGDLTYFILYKLDMIEQSLDALAAHLKREEGRIRRSESLVKLSGVLNLRQRLLIEHALRHPMHRYTVKSHANSDDVTPATARADLDGLTKLKLLVTEKDGREVIYRPAPLLNEKVAKAMRRKS
jgi:Fic family protein